MEKKTNGGDAIVVGGGVMGCAIGRCLARDGLSVVIVEPKGPEAGATWAAAGMLAPIGEAHEPGAFLDLGLRSLRLYPDFVAAIEEESGETVGFLRSGKLQIAFHDEDVSALEARKAWASEIVHGIEWVEQDDLHRLEPSLTPEARAGLLIPEDFQVDNRRLGAGLRIAAERAGARHRKGCVERVRMSGGKVTGVALAGGEALDAPVVVVAAGCWSGRIGGLPRPLPLRPIRGQMLALEAREVSIARIIASPDVYLVPRTDGTLLAGATVEEAGFRAETTAGGIRTLLEAAVRAAPLLEHAPVREIWAGLRPGTPDDLPILGEDPDAKGLFYATGHYRNGILLAPVTALAIAGMIGGEAPFIDPEAFRPDRFGDL